MVFVAQADDAALGITAGQEVYIDVGSEHPTVEGYIMIPIPRGRLGHVLRAWNDGVIQLVASEPPVLSDSPELILQRAVHQSPFDPPSGPPA
jgi:hypothetical protein